MATETEPQQPAASPRVHFTIPNGFWSWTTEQRRAWLGDVASSAASQLKPTTTRYEFFRYEGTVGRYPADTHAPTEILSISGLWRQFAVPPDRRSMPISPAEAQRIAGDGDLYAPTSSHGCQLTDEPTHTR